MGNTTNTMKAPLPQERIFAINMLVTVIVAAIFLIKDLVAGAFTSAIVLGVCLVVFVILALIMKKLNVSQLSKQMTVCILLVLLVFFISINSGAYYSDDFPLFLALLALTGLYLEPKCTAVQSCVIFVALIVMYILHPEKTESLSQYIMCVVIYVVAAVVNFILIRRGRAYIELANARAKEASQLIEDIKVVSDKLHNNYESSFASSGNLRTVDLQLNQNSHDLLGGIRSTYDDSQHILQSCGQVQTCIQFANANHQALEELLVQMRSVMAASKDPMQAMHSQLKQVSETIRHTTEVFDDLQGQVRCISGLTGQLGDIAFNTKMLALNASVEAARAGEFGAGFSVVAGEVETLAADSDRCSNEVTEVVTKIKGQVNASVDQLLESYKEMEELRTTLLGIDESFRVMIPHFQSAFSNMGSQGDNFSTIDSLINGLQARLSDLDTSTEAARAAVNSINNGISAYRTHFNQMARGTKEICDLSSSIANHSAQ